MFACVFMRWLTPAHTWCVHGESRTNAELYDPRCACATYRPQPVRIACLTKVEGSQTALPVVPAGGAGRGSIRGRSHSTTDNSSVLLVYKMALVLMG